MVDHGVQYRAVLERIKSLPRGRSTSKRERYTGTLDTFMSLGLGSEENGATFSHPRCANRDVLTRGSTLRPCPNSGMLVCSKCCLVKYCSEQCQRQHWPKHRVDCEHPLMDPDWQPTWVDEGREPNFSRNYSPSSDRTGRRSLFGKVPSIDCLQLCYNEGKETNCDFKLCFAASTDIRNLVKTVNGLPKDYRGKCEILLNDVDAVVVNRSLVILYALLSSGTSIEESAELATHLMYSAALSHTSAAYLRECICVIYGDGPSDGDMSFQSCMKTRGEGRLLTMQTTMAIKRPMEMFLSTYELPRGLQSMRSILTDPLREDDREKTFVSLKPPHRLSLARFWQTGVLVPYSLDVRRFSQPNRLVFSVNGDWLGNAGANPLHGWDATSVLATGAKYGIDPADMFGCLFVHVKRELMDFARRMRDFHIDIHLTQFDPRVLSKGIAIGAIPGFDGSCFDRVETSNLVDDIGICECLTHWGPLLSRRNEHANILMHSREWHGTLPNAIAHANPRAVRMLVERCKSVCTFDPGLRTALAQGMKSPAVLKLIESLDAFVDHQAAFEEYLNQEEADEIADGYELRRRSCHRVHPKRFGVPLSAPHQRLPDLSKDEFYNLFTLSGAEFPTRFIEFENA